jgi:glycosyltransferase involved in cell wall biosynthesis
MALKKRKVAVLGCLASFISSYSIASIVEDQLKMLKKFGEDVVFITTDDFTDQHLVPEGVEIRYYPRYKGSLDPDKLEVIEFEKYVFEASSILRNNLSDCTHVIQHDLLFIHSYVPVNWAIRACATLLPKLKWFHWQHSAPSNMPNDCAYPFTGCYMDMDNSTFIYLNRTDIPGVASRYAIPENKIAIVHNFIDFEKQFNFHPLTSELVDAYNLFDADTICIYPTRITPGKQIEKVIKLFEQLKKHGQTVKLLICNSWSNGQKEKEYIEKLIQNSSLTSDDLFFTSSFQSKWAKENSYDIELGLPHQVVFDLLRLSDLFILPSTSECCSMIMLEAAASKNLMVLNSDLFSLYEFGGQKLDGDKSTRAFYLEFGSVTRPIANYNPSEEAWYSQKAQSIIQYQKDNQAIGFFKFVRKRHNPKWIYFSEIKPLLDQ